MLSEKYTKLNDLAGPDSYVAVSSQDDLAYILHFQKTCKRYQLISQRPTKTSETS